MIILKIFIKNYIHDNIIEYNVFCVEFFFDENFLNFKVK